MTQMPCDVLYRTDVKIIQTQKFRHKKSTDKLSVLFLSTQSRDRTGMEVNPLVFETSASTNSAIWAFDFGCKVKAFF